ncbi:VCBS repeat-containing protein, partial [Amylibacter sp.]|nr:VCBS repeat-containing protein [Amylibacter sp.]
NNGRGNFSKNNKTRLPQHKKKWGVIPELSAWDLDNDGDMDIALSRTGSSYKGSAVQIIENLGNKKFKDRGIIQLDSNDGWVYGIRFRDMDKDGDNDLFLSSYSAKTSGVVVINNGNFDFTLVMPAQARKLYKTIYSMIYPNN